jgi:hypothetical protein
MEKKILVVSAILICSALLWLYGAVDLTLFR